MEGEIQPAPQGLEPLSTRDKALRVALSSLIGAVIGVVIAEVVANSLIEISLTYAFAIIFGVAFILLGIVLGWRIWTGIEDPIRRWFLMGLALMVFVSGICCFFLQENWFSQISPGAKVPMYALLGISLAFSLAFSLTEFVNLGVCDTCCSTNFRENPLLANKIQVFVIFGGTMIMGMVFGLMFGLMDVEDDNAAHPKLRQNLITSLILGSVLGTLIGFVNEWLRLRQVAQYRPLSPQNPAPVPTGYDDI
eukprot:TRINITY_DN61_c0_g1_i1.p2 TRINITY_DN61_c0_g1~~TRINITY_DN61_c0_g1_i1.p2  ORF type:complete len:259 (+),score=43.22 TRINITY_DN61_c0_g1_i1:29-778(+)